MPAETEKHTVIIIPGLGDDAWFYRFATKNWEEKYGFTPCICLAPWRGKPTDYIKSKAGIVDSEPYKQKLKRQIENATYHKRSGKISFLGISAGGPLAVEINASLDSKYNVACVCSRFRMGSRKKPLWPVTFDEAVHLSQEKIWGSDPNNPSLSENERRKILTISSLFDEVVPINTSYIPGARNEHIWVPTHMLAIRFAFLYPQRMIDFLRSN